MRVETTDLKIGEIGSREFITDSLAEIVLREPEGKYVIRFKAEIAWRPQAANVVSESVNN